LGRLFIEIYFLYKLIDSQIREKIRKKLAKKIGDSRKNKQISKNSIMLQKLFGFEPE
jgi:hypothetical protein